MAIILTPDLRSKNNTISVAISLEAGADQARGEGEERSRGAGAGQLTQIGSMLFTRGVSGTRVITGGNELLKFLRDQADINFRS